MQGPCLWKTSAEPKVTQKLKSYPSDSNIKACMDFLEREITRANDARSRAATSNYNTLPTDELNTCFGLVNDLRGVVQDQEQMKSSIKETTYFENRWFRTASQMHNECDQCISFCRSAQKICHTSGAISRAENFHKCVLIVDELQCFIRTPPIIRTIPEIETGTETMEVEQQTADCQSSSSPCNHTSTQSGIMCSKVNTFQQEKSELEFRVQTLEREKSELQWRFDASTASLADVQNEKINLERWMKAEITSLQRQKDVLEHQKSELEQRFAASEENAIHYYNLSKKLNVDGGNHSERFQQLKETIRILEGKNGNLNTRLSKLMETQERERVDAHEDLCDHYRPSNILMMFRELYKKKYLDISEALDKHLDEESICTFLLTIIEVAYRQTNCSLEKFRDHVSDAVSCSIKKQFKVDSKRNLPVKMSDAINEMIREQVDSATYLDSITNKVYHKMKETFRIPKESSLKEMLITYISECVKVTFLMNACTPPMWIDFTDNTYDPKKHTRYDGKGEQILYLVWPCVYFSKKSFEAGKPVMEKGEVVLCCLQSTSVRESAQGSRSCASQNEIISGECDEVHENLFESSVPNSQINKRMNPRQKTTLIQVSSVNGEEAYIIQQV